MSANEYSGYLHAKVSGDAGGLQIDYDGHYCAYFKSSPSRWTLHLSDETRRALGTARPEKRVVDVPAGVGRHTVRIP